MAFVNLSLTTAERTFLDYVLDKEWSYRDTERATAQGVFYDLHLDVQHTIEGLQEKLRAL